MDRTTPLAGIVAAIAAKDRQAVADRLDAMDHAGRVAVTRRLPRAAQAQLFELVRGFLPLAPQDLVPAQLPDMLPIPHVGTNNMPLARRFAKVMYRQPGGIIAGYNQQTWAWITGPGYFTVEAGEAGELVVDYTALPRQAPAHWPRIVNNSWGLSYFVYRDMRDTLRRVSSHVTVGHAVRSGKSLPNYFILVRGAPEVAFAAVPPALGAVG